MDLASNGMVLGLVGKKPSITFTRYLTRNPDQRAIVSNIREYSLAPIFEYVSRWFKSVLEIKSPHWRAQLIVWIVGAHKILTSEIR